MKILLFRLWLVTQTDIHNLHSCDNGVLAPPAPSIDGTFLVIALQSPYFDSAFVQASGLAFRIGGDPPATYCPDEVAQLGDCPPGTETVWTCADGYCVLVCPSESVNFGLSLMSVRRMSRSLEVSRSTSAPTARSATPKHTQPTLPQDRNTLDSR